MATNYNSDLSNELRDVCKLQTRDKVPNELADKIIPVIDVNPKHSRLTNFLKSGTLTNATSATIFTADTDRETYITSANMSMIKDAGATTTSISLTAVKEDGEEVAIIAFPSITLTAHTAENSCSLLNPLRIKKGSIVRITSGTNNAIILARACIQGYTLENWKA